jgi:hypothetical protein
MIIFLACFVIVLITFWIIINYFIYRRNVKRLDALMASQVVKPGKARFAFSWFVFTLVAYIPAVLMLWVIEIEFPYIFAWIMPLMLLSLAPPAYPYYNLAIFPNKINGATQWGWLWNRTEINFHEIDTAKTLRQHLGRTLGITVIHSTNGVKILTLGLDDNQLSGILDLANKNEI